MPTLGSVTPRIRIPPAELVVTFTYLLGLLGAEIVLVTVGAFAASLAHAVLLVVMLIHGASRRHEPYAGVLVALGLAPVMRLLSLVVPVDGVPAIVWIGLVGTPMLGAVLVASRVLRIGPGPMGLTEPVDPAVQALVGGLGLPISLVAYLFLRPEAIVTAASPLVLVSGLVAVSIFVGLAEELVFRGIIQSAARAALGAGGAILMGGGAGAIMMLGSGSASQAIAYGAFNFALAVVVERTNSLWGAIGAHAIGAFGLLVLWPIVLR